MLFTFFVCDSDFFETSKLRLDLFLCSKFKDLSRSKISKFIFEKKVKVNNKFIEKQIFLKLNDKIDCDFVYDMQRKLVPQDLNLEVLYEDEYLAIVNKPKGMLTHPTHGDVKGTLVNALLYKFRYLSSINGVDRPGIVHRLDKYTSGLLIIAKNDDFHHNIARQIKEHKFKRKYETIISGRIVENFGIICDNLIKDNKNPCKRLCFRRNSNHKEENSKFAVTIFKKKEEFKNFSLVELELKTGRTHQIRVHLSKKGNPVFGDDLYGFDKFLKKNKISKEKIGNYEGQCLHAKRIEFWHPYLKKNISFESELPGYFNEILFNIKSGAI